MSTTWTFESISSSGVAEVDFVFSDGSDFVFSDGSTDFVFREGVDSTVWSEPSINSASWTDETKN